jgi:lysophospholipase L1-like esterase
MMPPPAPRQRRIEVIGDSITGGADIVDFTGRPRGDGTRTYATYIARYFNADVNILSKGGMGLNSSIFGGRFLELPDRFPRTDDFNPGIGGDIPWDHSSFPADVVIINLGTNDARGIQDTTNPDWAEFTVEAFRDRYVQFAEDIIKAYPNAKIIGTIGMMDRLFLYPYIVQAAEIFNERHGREIFFTAELTPLPEDFYVYVDGVRHNHGHPNYEGHVRHARQLIELIKDITDWG